MARLSGGDMLALAMAGLTAEEIQRVERMLVRLSDGDRISWVEPRRGAYIDPDFWISNNYGRLKVGVLYTGEDDEFIRPDNEQFTPTRIVVVYVKGQGVPHGAQVREP